MRGFVAGFVVASLLWATLAVVYLMGVLDPLLLPELEMAEASDAGVDAAPAVDGGPARPRRRRWRRSRRRRARRQRRERRRARADERMETGDDLEAAGPRELDMESAGAEARLSPGQIDSAFGRSMPAIRRCLLLLETEASGRGRVVFSMRVAGSGQPTAVRLSGPRSLVSGAVGGCLRRTGRGIRFPAFDGTETTFSYPITFD